MAEGLRKRYGALVVLDDVGLELRAGEAVGVVGPNGAGKTTLLDVLAGALRPNAGSVALRDADVTRLGAAARCTLGIGRTHQIPRPFVDMTVFENVLVGARGSDRQDRALAALETTELVGVANRRAGALGLLDRKRLEMARALATDPAVLLLDEVAGGLTEEETHALVGSIQALVDAGIGVVWIEHVVQALLRVATRLVCMSAGRVIAEGEPEAVMSDKAVMAAYLGT